MTDRIEKTEQEFRELLYTLRDCYDGYPSTDAQWDFIATRVRKLNSLLDLRAGLIGIESTSGPREVPR